MEYTFILNFSKEEIKLFPKNIKVMINQIVDEIMVPKNMENDLIVTNQLTKEQQFLLRHKRPTLRPQTKLTVELTNPWIIEPMKRDYNNFLGHLHHTGYWTLNNIVNFALGRMIYVRNANDPIQIPMDPLDKTQCALALVRWDLDYSVGKQAGEF